VSRLGPLAEIGQVGIDAAGRDIALADAIAKAIEMPLAPQALELRAG
jgi:hypothetical protein